MPLNLDGARNRARGFYPRSLRQRIRGGHFVFGDRPGDLRLQVAPLWTRYGRPFRPHLGRSANHSRSYRSCRTSGSSTGHRERPILVLSGDWIGQLLRRADQMGLFPWLHPGCIILSATPGIRRCRSGTPALSDLRSPPRSTGLPQIWRRSRLERDGFPSPPSRRYPSGDRGANSPILGDCGAVGVPSWPEASPVTPVTNWPPDDRTAFASIGMNTVLESASTLSSAYSAGSLRRAR